MRGRRGARASPRRSRAAGASQRPLELADWSHQPLGCRARGRAILLTAKIIEWNRPTIGDPEQSQATELVGSLDRSRHERRVRGQRDPRWAGMRSGLMLLAQPLPSPRAFGEHDHDLTAADEVHRAANRLEVGLAPADGESPTPEEDRLQNRVEQLALRHEAQMPPGE